ncbi:hypothetical protein HFP72_02925 [Nocardiopsis sp. ARC36]
MKRTQSPAEGTAPHASNRRRPPPTRRTTTASAPVPACSTRPATSTAPEPSGRPRRDRARLRPGEHDLLGHVQLHIVLPGTGGTGPAHRPVAAPAAHRNRTVAASSTRSP